MFSQSFINAARQQVRGIDLSGSYGRNVGDGRLTLRGSVSWLDSSQQTTSAQDNFDLAGSISNPAKINGRIGAVWSEGGFSASAFANYTGGVREDFWSAGVGERRSEGRRVGEEGVRRCRAGGGR